MSLSGTMARFQNMMQRKRRLAHSLKSISCLLFAMTLMQPAALAASLAEQAQQESKQLSTAFNQQQSFQAEYQAVSAKGQARIRLIMNQQRGFALVSVAMDKDPEPSYWVVLDYAADPIRPGMIKMFVVVPEAGLQRGDLSFKEIFASLDHPLGILRFLNAQSLRLQGKPAEIEQDWLPKTPMLELGLTAEHLIINLGVSTREGERFASWLEPETLAQASQVDVKPQSVNFVFAAGRVLEIDRKTGMMLKDVWNQINEERIIRQTSFQALQEQRPYQEQIPGFADLPVNQMPMRQMYQQFAQQLLTEFAEAFLPQFRADSTLPALHSQQRSALRQAARFEIRAQVRRNLQPEAVQAYQAEVLQPAYQKYLQTHAQAANLSFVDYLSRYLAAAEADPEHVQMPGLRQMAAQVAASKEQMLSQLSNEQAQVMSQLWSWGWPSIQEAWALELLSASIERLQAQK